MKCRDAHEMLNSYLDNKTDPMNDRILADHINSCPVCRVELESLIKYKDKLASVKPVSAPDNFLSELHKKIDSETEPWSFKEALKRLRYTISSLNFPIEAAGVLALALVVFFLYRPFFNETVQIKSSEYGIESPAEKPAALEITEPAEKEITPDRFESDKKITKDKSDPPEGEIILKNESPGYNKADDKIFSGAEKTVSSERIVEAKKARSLEHEKQFMNEEKSFSGENGLRGNDSEGAMSIQKDSIPVTMLYPDNIFRKYNVSVIKKDIAENSKSYYRIKVDSKKYNSLITDLKKNSTIDIKIITRTETFYEIELFIKNNKN